mmetsp:Transcript_6951/g.20861  ORF Transcript_6951/g.20861 Transcript_6951/m.20861 type:complete len:239 (+) Transcript_6951:339-1055(+)
MAVGGGPARLRRGSTSGGARRGVRRAQGTFGFVRHNGEEPHAGAVSPRVEAGAFEENRADRWRDLRFGDGEAEGRDVVGQGWGERRGDRRPRAEAEGGQPAGGQEHRRRVQGPRCTDGQGQGDGRLVGQAEGSSEGERRERGRHERRGQGDREVPADAGNHERGHEDHSGKYVSPAALSAALRFSRGAPEKVERRSRPGGRLLHLQQGKGDRARVAGGPDRGRRAVSENRCGDAAEKV